MMSSGIYKKKKSEQFVGLQTSKTLGSVASVSALVRRESWKEIEKLSSNN